MKKIAMIAAVTAALCSTAFAGGNNNSKNALNVGVGVSTGKGGLVGSLLGSNSGHGKTGIAAAVKVDTGKGGVLGLLTGSKSGHH